MHLCILLSRTIRSTSANDAACGEPDSAPPLLLLLLPLLSPLLLLLALLLLLLCALIFLYAPRYVRALRAYLRTRALVSTRKLCSTFFCKFKVEQSFSLLNVSLLPPHEYSTPTPSFRSPSAGFGLFVCLFVCLFVNQHQHTHDQTSIANRQSCVCACSNARVLALAT